jgi:hypothetical protein
VTDQSSELSSADIQMPQCFQNHEEIKCRGFSNFFDSTGTKRGHHLSKLPFDRLFLAQRGTNKSQRFHLSPSQMTRINASLLFRRSYHMLEMTITKFFFNSQDEPDRRSGQTHEKLFHGQIQEFSKRYAQFALWPQPLSGLKFLCSVQTATHSH